MNTDNKTTPSRAEIQRYESLILSMKQILLFATPSLSPDAYVSMVDSFVELVKMYKPEGYESKENLENIW